MSASILDAQSPLSASDAVLRLRKMSSSAGAMPSWLDTMPHTPAGSGLVTVSGQLAGSICACTRSAGSLGASAKSGPSARSWYAGMSPICLPALLGRHEVDELPRGVLHLRRLGDGPDVRLPQRCAARRTSRKRGDAVVEVRVLAPWTATTCSCEPCCIATVPLTQRLLPESSCRSCGVMRRVVGPRSRLAATGSRRWSRRCR